MKVFAFRPPGFSTNPLVGITVPELSDLDERTLGRLVDEMRHRLMIRDTLVTIERLYWSASVSQACWSTIHGAVLEELHRRALVEHVERRAQRLVGREALSAEAGRALAAYRAAKSVPGVRPTDRRWWPTPKGVAAAKETEQ